MCFQDDFELDADIDDPGEMVAVETPPEEVKVAADPLEGKQTKSSSRIKSNKGNVNNNNDAETTPTLAKPKKKTKQPGSKSTSTETNKPKKKSSTSGAKPKPKVTLKIRKSRLLTARNSESPPTSPNTRSSKQVTATPQPQPQVVKKVMSADQMRELVAELLQKISTPDRLSTLGFGTRKIDDVLHDSISSSGRKPCDATLPISERLRKNVDILLEWTIPPQFMAKFRKEKRTTEELLEELTS